MAKTEEDQWVSLSDSDPGNVGYFSVDHDQTHCMHGTYVGYPGGPDYICGYCEDGMNTLVIDSRYELVINPDTASSHYTGIEWWASELTAMTRPMLRKIARIRRFMRHITQDVGWTVQGVETGKGYWE